MPIMPNRIKFRASSDQYDWASTTIQRFFRGSKVRFFEPRKKQMDTNPLGHATLKGALYKINSEHELWGPDPLMKCGYSYKRHIGFEKEGIERHESTNMVHTINYHEGRDNPSRLFADVICSVFTIPKKSLTPIFLHSNARSLQPLFDRTIAKLEDGHKVSIWDGQSTKLPPSALAIDMVKECRVKYEYFMVHQNQDYIARTMRNEADTPLVCNITPIPSTTEVSGSTDAHQDGLDFDDLELRLMKIMELPDAHNDGLDFDDLDLRLMKLMELPYAQ